MVKQHLKRLVAPGTWKIKRKNIKFTTKPMPGGQPKELVMPLSMVIRDLLGKATTKKEVKYMLTYKEVQVDGKKRKDYRYPVGLMDVVSFPKIKEDYRLILNKKNNLKTIAVDKKEANLKLAKLTGKKTLGKNKTQLNLSDGRNITVKKDEYKTGSSLLIELPKQEIKDSFELKKGNTALVTHGKHAGTTGSIEKVGSKIVKIKTGKEEFTTNKEYALVIGKTKPAIKVE